MFAVTAVFGLLPTHSAFGPASSKESFFEFVEDGVGNLSIPTAFGRRPQSGCACQFPGLKPRVSASQALVKEPPPFCFSTYATESLDMYAKDSCQNQDVSAATGTGHMGPEDEALITRCLTPDRSSPDLPPATLFMLGDSHSGALLPGISHAVRGRYQVRRFRTNTVGVFPHRFDAASTKASTANAHMQRYVDYYHYMLATLRTVVQPGDVVLLMQQASTWTDNLETVSRDASGMIVDVNNTAVELMERDLWQGVVQPNGARLVVVGDWPFFADGQLPVGGFGGIPKGNPAKAVASVYAQAGMQKALEPVLKRNPTLIYFSLLPFFCKAGTNLANDDYDLDAGTCSWLIPGTNINGYYNSQHIGTVGALYLWPHICEALTNSAKKPKQTARVAQKKGQTDLGAVQPDASLQSWLALTRAGGGGGA
jgi:hypothetical protein